MMYTFKQLGRFTLAVILFLAVIELANHFLGFFTYCPVSFDGTNITL